MAIYRGIGGTGDSATGEDVFGPNSSITSLDGITGGIEDPTYVRFAADNGGHIPLQGDLSWNTTEGTLDLGLNEGHVILQIGQETHYRITNLSGGILPNGSLLAFSGTTGNSGKLLAELYNGTQPSKYIIGIATEDIPNGNNGYVTHFGKIRGIQTNGANYGETWIDGDEVYPSPTGGLTKVLPEAPNAKQPIAVVVNSHVSNGILFVRVGGHTSLEDDELVQLTGLTDNDILQWDNAQGRFENRSLATAGVQPTLVSGVNIKTINSESLLGATDIAVTTAADIANMIETTDIGITVQGYDIDTAKYDDVTANFTGTLQNGGSNVVVDTDIGSTVLAYDANLQSFVSTFTLPTVDSTNGFVLQTNGTGTLQLAAPGGIPDGDKGDITVSTGGTVWTVDADAITYAKIQNVSATDRLLGRSTAGAGNIEEITCTAAGRALLDDADATAQRTTLGLGTIATQEANNVSISGGAINGTTVGATSPTTGSFTSLTDSGNLTFTGIGNRITGDFSNATTANRVMLQTSTTNGNTSVGTVPNGIATSSAYFAYNAQDASNASWIQMLAGLSGVVNSLRSGATGTGTQFPLTFEVNNSERMRIDTSGNVLVTNAAGLGYGTGAGGTVTQATSKATGVTINKPTGTLTTAADALGAGASTVFVFTNSLLSANDLVVASYSNVDTHSVTFGRPSAGQTNVAIKNISAGSLSVALLINFAIIKGASA